MAWESFEKKYPGFKFFGKYKVWKFEIHEHKINFILGFVNASLSLIWEAFYNFIISHAVRQQVVQLQIEIIMDKNI